MLLNVTNLNCRRGPKLIIANVSLSVTAGECIILRGPNGSGKTTLLRFLAGLCDSADIKTYDNSIAYSGHLDGVKSTLTVNENLSFWAGIYATNNLDKVIKKLNLEDLSNNLVGELSTGQKRRLGLARMLISNAKIWLMDEPTSSLDTSTSSLIFEAINLHCKNDGAAIISTHINLNIPKSRVLNMEDFAVKREDEDDPFLKGSFQ